MSDQAANLRAQLHSLQRREEQLQGILDSISDACILMDAEWHCTFVNGAAGTLLGREARALTGANLWSSIPELSGTLLEDQVRRSLHTEMPVRFDYYFSSQDVDTEVQCYPNGDGITLFFVDRTQSRRSEQRFQHAEDRFQAMADTVPVLLFGMDTKGRVDYVNHRFSSYTGVAPRDLWGQSWRESIHPEDLQRFDHHFRTAQRRRESLRNQCRLKDSHGTFRWFVLRARPQVDAQGEIHHWFGSFTDIHQEKGLQSDLEDASRHKDEFISMLAHELRNPLAPIRSAAQVLSMTLSEDAKKRELTDIIERQVAQMAHLLDDLLDVSRIERGKIRVRVERTHLTEHVAQSVRDLHPVAESAGLLFDVRITDEPIYVMADPARLAQSIGNLVHNAIKFTPEGGRVTVKVTHDSKSARISVEDNGVGIDPVTLRRVFEPFRQAEQAYDRERGGLGLGLALVRGLVELQNGQVRIESPGTGEGTTATIELPKAD